MRLSPWNPGATDATETRGFLRRLQRLRGTSLGFATTLLRKSSRGTAISVRLRYRCPQRLRDAFRDRSHRLRPRGRRFGQTFRQLRHQPTRAAPLLEEPFAPERLVNQPVQHVGIHDRPTGFHQVTREAVSRVRVHIFEVDKSRVTKTINAYVTGIGGSKRIVLWDTAIAQQQPREVLAEMGHEMGHYVLGHVLEGILVQSLMLLAVLYMVSLSATAMIRRFTDRFGFDRVEDIASVPLIFLLINLFFFVISPAWMAFSRHQEHEADRFALELTHDNHALGTHLVKLQERNLSIPRPGWFPEWWRATHPSLGDRIDFANAYKPWASGLPIVYGHLFK